MQIKNEMNWKNCQNENSRTYLELQLEVRDPAKRKTLQEKTNADGNLAGGGG